MIKQPTQTIISNPKILGGTPVIKNTRIPASLVIDLIKRGYTTNLISSEYPSLNKRRINAFLSSISSNFNVPTAPTL